jgi:hypothetical protein
MFVGCGLDTNCIELAAVNVVFAPSLLPSELEAGSRADSTHPRTMLKVWVCWPHSCPASSACCC